MSLVSLGRLLPQAFDRIDKAKKIQDAHRGRGVAGALNELFPESLNKYSVSPRGSTVVIHTDSIAFKHKVYASQEKILAVLREVGAKTIVFTPQKK